MRRKRIAEEQIALALRQAESVATAAEVCRKMQISEQGLLQNGVVTRVPLAKNPRSGRGGEES